MKHDPMTKEIIRAMREARVPERLIYAFEKTGRIVTRENSRHLSSQDLQEWNDALRQYDEEFSFHEESDAGAGE